MSSKSKYVFITGVAGFIGMHLANFFLKEGYNVLGIDNENDYYDVNLKLRRLDQLKSSKKATFLYFKGDLLDDNLWTKVSQYEIISVFHLAAQAGVRYSITNPWAYLQSNVLGFQKVLDFINSNSINSFYYASSSSVYGNIDTVPFKESFNCNKPESYYAATKITNEMMCHAYEKTHNLKSVGLRFFTVYGPWGRPDMAPFLFVESAINKKSINVFNYGNQKRDFTYIDDIVLSIFLLFKNEDLIKNSTILNIGNGSPSNLEDFLNIIERETGSLLDKKYIKAQKGDVAITYADTSKLESIINFKPNTSLESGIKSFVNWYRKFYNIK
jgi:UDP-glucuronate 4-epimerase